jgi:hypothetical protein
MTEDSRLGSDEDPLRRVFQRAEEELIRRYAGQQVAWVGPIGRVAREDLEKAIPAIRIVRRPDDITRESARYHTLILAPSFGCQIGPQALCLLCDLVLEPNGRVILPGIRDVTRVLKQFSDGEYSPEIIGPYGLLNEKPLLDGLFGASVDAAKQSLRRILSDADAVAFWAWLEGSLHSVLPPWISDRNLVVLSTNGSIRNCVDIWERFDACSTLDASAFAYLMGDSFNEFQQGITQRVSKMPVFDLIAKLSDLFECRLERKIDFFTLLTPKQRAEVGERVAWYWADHAHEPLDREDLHVDGVFLPKEMDFMLFDPFIEVVAEITEQYP